MKSLSFLGVRGFPLCLGVTRNVKEGKSRDDVLDAKSGANHYATAYQKAAIIKKQPPPCGSCCFLLLQRLNRSNKGKVVNILCVTAS